MNEYVATMVVGPAVPEGLVGAVVKKLDSQTSIQFNMVGMEVHVLSGYTLDNIRYMELDAYTVCDLLQKQEIKLEPYKEYFLNIEGDQVYVSRGTYYSVDGPIEVYYVSL
jgi:hypothetical protein